MIAVLFDPTIALSSKEKNRLAVIDGYKWASKNPKLERVLNARLDPDGPGDDPDPDLNAATEAIETYGGKIIKQEQPLEPPKGSVL